MHDSKGMGLLKIFSLLCLVLKKKKRGGGGQKNPVIFMKTNQTYYNSTKITLWVM